MPRHKWSTRVELPKPSKRHRALEWCKSGLIGVMTLSAVYLTGCCLTYSGTVGDARGFRWVSDLITTLGEPLGPVTSDYVSGQPTDEVARIALCGTDGMGNVVRYGVQYDTEGTRRLSEALAFPISTAFSSAKEPKQVDEEAWRGALKGPGVYFELLGQTPLGALGGWLKDSTVSHALPKDAKARRFMLTYQGGENASLYYSNETDGMYYACETGVAYEGAGGLGERLESELGKSGPNWATFAFELDQSAGYGGVDPYVMITDPSHAKAYRVGNPISTQDGTQIEALQQALSFSDHYEAGGVVVLWEGNSEQLRLDNMGVAVYKASDQVEPRYPVETSGGMAEMVEATRKVAELTVGAWSGAADLYLERVEQVKQGGDEFWELRFGYSLNGSPVLLPGGESAACFTVRNGRIDAYTLRFRSYEDTGETTPILPMTQAVAAMNALHPEGRELTLCYQDSGGDTVGAGWAVR